MIALNDRVLLKISGDGAEGFLQNLITTDMENVTQGGCHAGALLTPQGKIQFEFLISGRENRFLIETGADQIDGLMKRLIMYRLRLPIDIDKVETLQVFATQNANLTLRDHRFQSEIFRVYSDDMQEDGDSDWLKQAMIREGVAQSGIDFDLNDIFPHDINFDQIGGMSFSKGCYVGQEVISRMHHKGGVRKRLMVVTSSANFDDHDEATLTIDSKPIGTIGIKTSNKALAICRIDKASQALHDGIEIMLGDHSVMIEKPVGGSFTYPLESEPN